MMTVHKTHLPVHTLKAAVTSSAPRRARSYEPAPPRDQFGAPKGFGRLLICPKLSRLPGEDLVPLS